MQNPIEQLLIKPIIRLVIGEQKLRFYESINWEEESDRLRQPHLIYPSYYTNTV
ncbi:hypothetical protein [Nostoc sp. FACHB-110]|uniref:hypothetical protein n=1 Tax=Nostoc sp. FACHB-110 TaxID=2692834 RepID=UPI001681EDEE|nr:hypothetical protein [Nostoc sp. FACHB-110]MBD2437411.1 hypothetical protein [Nostoc sp. FACHB-110]